MSADLVQFKLTTLCARDRGFKLWAMFYTVPDSPVLRQHSYELPFTHISDLGTISVTRRNCASPVAKVERHISDRFCSTLWCNCLVYPDVSLLMKMCAQRKAGRRQRARRLCPSHGPLRFITSHSRFAFASTKRKTNRLRRRLPRHGVRCVWTTASLCRYCGSYWTGQFFLSARKPIRYSVNIALQSFLYGGTAIRLYKAPYSVSRDSSFSTWWWPSFLFLSSQKTKDHSGWHFWNRGKCSSIYHSERQSRNCSPVLSDQEPIGSCSDT